MRLRPPALGADSRQILETLGLSSEEIARLDADELIAVGGHKGRRSMT